MPPDLTDLMERATSAAPPEPHDAADITRLAAHRQRRRTASIAGGVAFAVVVAGALGYDVTRGHDTAPEPTGPYKYDQTVDLSSAVPASSLPGYHLEPWTIPSVQHFGPSSSLGPLPTYSDIDAQGRLMVRDLPGGDPEGSYRVRLYDRPGQPPQPLRAPPSAPGVGDHTWMPSFLDDGRLLWMYGDAGRRSGFHVTDLDGGHDVFVRSSSPVGMGNGTASWVSGEYYWFVVLDNVDPQASPPVLTYSLYRGRFSGEVTKLADDVAIADVADGVVAWVTTDGRVVTEGATGSPHTVDVRLDDGCSLTPTSKFDQNSLFVASRTVIALTERCGSDDDMGDRFLAFDPNGHRLVHVTGLTAVRMSLGGNALILLGVDPQTFEVEQLRYDLVTPWRGSARPTRSATPTPRWRPGAMPSGTTRPADTSRRSPTRAAADWGDGHRLSRRQRLPARPFRTRRRRDARPRRTDASRARRPGRDADLPRRG
jgi:hypothetical protein